MKKILVLGIVVLALCFAGCGDGAGDGDGLPDATVSQPPASAGDAGSVGVYTSGTNLMINSGTQVYYASSSYNGQVSAAPMYSSGSAQPLSIVINDESNINGTGSLPASGVLGTITIPAPPDSYLVPASIYFDEIPGGIIKTGTSVLVGRVYISDSSYHGLYIFTDDTFFQVGEPVSSEEYFYIYSKGDVTAQMPKTQVMPGMYAEVNIQLKAGWNCVAKSVSGISTTTITHVSKNSPSTARWVLMEWH